MLKVETGQQHNNFNVIFVVEKYIWTLKEHLKKNKVLLPYISESNIETTLTRIFYIIFEIDIQGGHS